jgi:hypothetical protein
LPISSSSSSLSDTTGNNNTTTTNNYFAWSELETEDNNQATRGCIFLASRGGGCYQLPLFPKQQKGDHDSVSPSSSSSSSSSSFLVKRISVTSNTGSHPIISSPAKGRFCLGVEKSIADALGECNAMAQILHSGDEGVNSTTTTTTTTTTAAALDSDGEIIQALRPRMDSMAKYAMIARGDAEYYVRLPRPDYIENTWDHAAASVVLQEAGGTMTDTQGHAIDFGLGAQLSPEVRGILASNGGWFHTSLVQSYWTQKQRQQ